MSPSTSTLLTLLHLLPLILCSATSSGSHHAPHDLVHSSCSHARYPHLCVRTLSTYAGPTSTPKDVAQAALKVSLSRARSVSRFLNAHASSFKAKRERTAVADCVEQIADSVDELSQSLGELKRLDVGEGEEFRWRLSNAETWVSTALTDDDTCLDGFGEVDGQVRSDVRRKIMGVVRVTSNALYMINRLDDKTTGKKGSGVVLAVDDDNGRL